MQQGSWWQNNSLLNFFTAFAVSFLGSIPLGSINLTALQIYLQTNFRSVVYFSLSASFIEFFYSYLAIKGEIILSQNITLNYIFSYITMFAFFVLGILNISSNEKGIVEEIIRVPNMSLSISNYNIIRKGFILSVLNPQAIPFWLVLSNFLEKQDLAKFHSTADTLYYTSGVAFGTFFCLLVFALFIGKFLKQRQIRMKFLNRAIGILFISLALFQLGKILFTITL